MDDYTLNGAMTVLYLAKLMEEHGRLEKFYEVIGCDDLSLDYDGQYLAELAACESIFADTRTMLQEGKHLRPFEYEPDREVYVLRDPLLTRFDALCREYEARKGVPQTEDPYVRKLEAAIHHALALNDYSYDYLLVDGTKDRKGPKLLLFLFEEFCAIGEVPDALCAILDFCKDGIARIERELSREPSKIISLPAPLPEYKEAA